jgi:hypothetical protein
MAWEDAATLGERFEVVRGFLARALPRRARLGRTYNGIAKAMLRHGTGLVERLVLHLRRQSLEHASAWGVRLGFQPVAVDGSRIDAPRTVDNQTHLGTAGRDGTHPQLALTTAWHMGLGVPWGWRIGPAAEPERTHLRQMLPERPAGCLLVADAGFTGHDLLREILDSHRHALIRVGANVTLLTAGTPEESVLVRGGRVWLARRGCPGSIPLRLIVVGRGQDAVYLVTDILSDRALSDADAATLYHMRWGVEVFYRQAKQTMERRKVRSACAARALLELHFTLVGLWLLMLMNAAGLARRGIDPLHASTAAAARTVRRWMRDPAARPPRPRGAGHAPRGVLADLARCVRDLRPRRSPKASSQWPHKKNEPRPRPPRLRPHQPPQPQPHQGVVTQP